MAGYCFLAIGVLHGGFMTELYHAGALFPLPAYGRGPESQYFGTFIQMFFKDPISYEMCVFVVLCARFKRSASADVSQYFVVHFC